MRWSYSDRYDANIKTAIEGADKVDPRGVDERYMVSRVEPPLLQKETSDLLSSLMQLVAGQTLAASSSVVEKGEQVVVGRCLGIVGMDLRLSIFEIYLGTPPEDLGNELIFLAAASNVPGLVLEPTDVPAGGCSEPVALHEVAHYHGGRTHVAVNLPRFW